MINASMRDSFLIRGAELFFRTRELGRVLTRAAQIIVGRFEASFLSVAVESARFSRRFALVFQGVVPFSGLLAPLVQGIVREPEQRSTDRHLASVAGRVNNHYTRWKETKAPLPTGNGAASISGHAITSSTKSRSALPSPWSQH
jgi:hypothetical protein